MRCRISAIQDEGIPDAMNKARLWLEDWINKALTGADFGCSDLTLMIVVFATASLTRAPKVSRLTANGPNGQILALHITIDHELIQSTGSDAQLALLASHIVSRFPTKPARKPKNLDYERLRQAILATTRPLANRAA